MYANGRAKGPGRWNRHGLQVSRANDCRPLPFTLQVLPMRMQPLPVHPDCATDRTMYGREVAMADTWYTRSFLTGRGLKRTPGAWKITVRDRTFYCDDALLALAWVRAANHPRHRVGATLTQAN